MTDRPRILFMCNAGPDVGGGHVMRSVTLAGALADRGAHSLFLAAPPARRVLSAFAPGTPIVPAASTAPDDLIAAARDVPADAVVLDHYGLDAAAHRAIAAGRPALVIDDLADRPLAADMVLDSGPSRRPEDYAGLLPPGADVLAGLRYAPVRPAFAASRAEALSRRGGPVARVLVSLGLTDVGAITARIIERLLPRLGEVAVDVALGAGAPSLPTLKRLAAADRRLSLHIDAQDMARLTLEADIAVGAAGSATWERCVLGLPSLLIVLADNQRQAAGAVEAAGAALVLDTASPGFEAGLDAAVGRLIDDAALRRRLAEASAALCDGLGAARVAEAFLSLISRRDAS